MSNPYTLFTVVLSIVIAMCAAMIVIMARRINNPPELNINTEVNASQAELVLTELESIAPHLLQLRKVGMILQPSQQLKELMESCDPIRVKRIIDLINGNVSLT